MQISPADEQVLSLFSSLEKQSLYQVVCAATPTDGTRNAYEKAAEKPDFKKTNPNFKGKYKRKN